LAAPRVVPDFPSATGTRAPVTASTGARSTRKTGHQIVKKAVTAIAHAHTA